MTIFDQYTYLLAIHNHSTLINTPIYFPGVVAANIRLESANVNWLISGRPMSRPGKIPLDRHYSHYPNDTCYTQ